MNFFSTGKPPGKETQDRRCPRCDAQPRLVRQILDPRTGRSIRMFECKCGERTWSDLYQRPETVTYQGFPNQ